ncbi:UNVERIFIED_CONTAM: hypothetical protein FKN15_004418 [Acipenser sinensis]
MDRKGLSHRSRGKAMWQPRIGGETAALANQGAVTEGVQQAPAVTSLATMGVQQAPIVLPSLSNGFLPAVSFNRAPQPPSIPYLHGIQQAPAATSLAAMGVQHDPIVVSSL